MIADIEAAPALCRLSLATELRNLRAAAGLTASEVAKRLVWGASKMNRIETGENAVVEPAEVIALCELYGADPETRALLVGYATVTKTKKDWWQASEYRPVIPPGLKAYLGLEATATNLHTYASEFVPGLLQTESYVRVIHQRALQGLSAEVVDRLVAVRMTRQEALRRTENPLRYVAVINEAVLRRTVGDPAVMRGQLAHIAEVASSLPNVLVQVVPFRAGTHPGMNGPFVVLQFPERLLIRPIVYLENLADAWVIRRENDVAKYEGAFTELQAVALGPQESLSMVKEAIKEF
ncbi:helix-turn-helix transcriptional regulator [Streptomyces sp. B1866]|uniref:helix-turn-helix domain-containing protein n=1 Tax=Streptomyces sp. B1866 TaxID=3075431 RepID=UPI0028924333|nr:helix-turn-helix transcriptional regulator [Streptomyces sp. B1866]MDT3396320.1 helix-turn-helix transcriptional regulator [Streptomyces sp. B1866]